jgi:NADH-quinone oxidoreductase subunit M
MKDNHHPLHDLSLREMLVMAPLILMVFWMGIFPNQFLDYSKASIAHLIQNKSNYNLNVMTDSEPSASTEGGN